MRYDLLTDIGGTGDLLFRDNDFVFTSTLQESLAQRINIRLSVWLGEWSYNLSFGTPYKQRILTNFLTDEQLVSEITRVILQEEDVTSIGRIEYKIDRATRYFEIIRLVVFCNDQQLDIPVSNPTSVFNEYPEPINYNDIEVCVLDKADLDAINELYYFVNIEGLPEGTYATWYNEWM